MVERRYFVTALLLAAALGSLLLLPRGDEPAPPAPLSRTGIGFYMDQAELSTTGEDGRVLYRLSAEQARQQLADGSIELDQVELRYGTQLEVPWQVRATTGSIPANDRIIRLSGDVVAIAGGAGELPMTIRTNYLELDPEAYIATTTHAVSIERPGGVLSARGMRLYLREDRLELLSDIRGDFAPPR
ncbi:MAG: LPS export ABC transporter periplasmic protein LptC [Chromatiales bacterium]|nr:LPS export ABC transporter periplasmic protein LptC [Chromatiales bacterium]